MPPPPRTAPHCARDYSLGSSHSPLMRGHSIAALRAFRYRAPKFDQATLSVWGMGQFERSAQPRIALRVLNEPDIGRAILFQNLFPLLEDSIALDAFFQKERP